GGDTEQLMADATFDVRGTRFTPDGRHLDFTALARTLSHFYRLDLESGEVTRLSDWTG
ncbi:MAG: hypothetical protein GWM90_26670, partial [Gemmatimonadetes bacterium]|nr:hypothetical protein [Gemmatimonadota bacterium]NIQ58496.1 hypothetical protein [Gemmatimonadota bacterium]NIU78695.1 hypothetical protein [Gammaproteobacteria bacterium]NIX47522.1 hypothetical protein [Gemmatimonadota bacterium]NIY11891.1 hypothetical protein [Gemmatimonadota bacterium]